MVKLIKFTVNSQCQLAGPFTLYLYDWIMDRTSCTGVHYCSGQQLQFQGQNKYWGN